MRIAFFGDTTHPNTVGWIDDLSRLFGLEIHAIDYVTSAMSTPRVRQHRLDLSLSGKIRYLLSGASLRRILERIEPDLVLGYRVISYGFAAARAGVRPLVLAGQGQGIVSPQSPPGSQFCARYALRRADLIHAWAEHMAQAMRDLGADPARIRVLHRGVRTDIFRPAPPATRAPIIVTSRQLAPYYRTDLVIRAVALLNSRGMRAELWISGEGPDRGRLENIVSALGITGSVRFLGRLEPEALAEIYRTASVYASMVPTDGVSSSLLEAMSSGLLPVAVDNVPNRAWIEQNRNGLLVAAGDWEGLASALASALKPEGTLSEAAERNRTRIMAEADRRTNLARMIAWWRELTLEKTFGGRVRTA